MKAEVAAKHALRVVTSHTKKLRKQYGENAKVSMQPAAILSKLGNMFGMSQGGLNKGLTLLASEGKLVRTVKGGKPVYSLNEGQ